MGAPFAADHLVGADHGTPGLLVLVYTAGDRNQQITLGGMQGARGERGPLSAGDLVPVGTANLAGVDAAQVGDAREPGRFLVVLVHG